MASKLDKTGFTNAPGQFASGVTVVITADGHGGFAGFTASAFSSLSLEPPLVLVCLQNDADCYRAFMEADQFTVSILSSDQLDMGLRFATKSIDKMQGTQPYPEKRRGSRWSRESERLAGMPHMGPVRRRRPRFSSVRSSPPG